jgi:hypothetical protein
LLVGSNPTPSAHCVMSKDIEDTSDPHQGSGCLRFRGGFRVWVRAGGRPVGW